MSENQTNTGPHSNEAIIDEITNNLESSLLTDTNVGEFVISPDSSTGNDLKSPSSSGAAPVDPQTSVSDIPQSSRSSEFDVSQADNDNTEEESDNDVDEDALRNMEQTLTDDQKAERKIIAEELKLAGNVAVKDKEYERALEKYTEGLNVCPLQFNSLRSILYCNRSCVKTMLERYSSAVKDCTKAIELDDKYTKAYKRRAICYEKLDKLEECAADLKKVLELETQSQSSTREYLKLITQKIDEKNEKLKTEMFAKLKDLGNMVLKPFGLSTENFKLEQDPESKGYKINFQQ